MSPTAWQRPCRNSTCPEATKHDSGYCEEHRAEKWRGDDRASASERGYDAQWSKVQQRYLARHPLCERCDRQDGMTRAADLVHHKTPINEGGARLDMSNLEALCTTHHQREHARG